MDPKVMLGMGAVVVIMAVIASVMRGKKADKDAPALAGAHVKDFTISNIFSGYITTDSQLCVKEGFNMSYKMRVVDLKKAVYMGYIKQGGAVAPNFFIKFYDEANKQVGDTLTVGGKKQLEEFSAIIREYGPHIEIASKSS